MNPNTECMKVQLRQHDITNVTTLEVQHDYIKTDFKLTEVNVILISSPCHNSLLFDPCRKLPGAQNHGSSKKAENSISENSFSLGFVITPGDKESLYLFNQSPLNIIFTFEWKLYLLLEITGQ